MPHLPPDEPDADPHHIERPGDPDEHQAHWSEELGEEEIDRAAAEATALPRATPAQERPRRLRRLGALLLALGAAWPLVREGLFLWVLAPPGSPQEPALALPQPALLLAGLGLFAAAMLLRRRHPAPLPAEAELDARNPQERGRVALVVVGLLVYGAIAWWARHGPQLTRGIYEGFHIWGIYWNEVATPSERTMWYTFFLAALLALAGAFWLLHRFVWRAYFPDLVRHDADHHRGARPERIGRLYRVKPFHPMRGDNPNAPNTDIVRYRVLYKHGGRLLPIFRFDHFDTDAAPKPVVFGVHKVECGRLERDPRFTFRRVPNPQRYGSAPLVTEFREAEVMEDHNRKTSIVMPGGSMNPAVMRQKFQNERIINPHVARQKRDAVRPMRFPRPMKMGGPRSAGHAHVDRLDEPAPRRE
jgi:hypothetical protein